MIVFVLIQANEVLHQFAPENLLNEMNTWHGDSLLIRSFPAKSPHPPCPRGYAASASIKERTCFACHKWRRSCAAMSKNPLPTVNRAAQKNGLLNRTLFMSRSPHFAIKERIS